jgi:hypothetical protein
MADPRIVHPQTRPAARTWSRALRVALIVCALGLAVLPLPVTWFGLLPAYRMQGRFLLFYAPVVCLLLLGYVFYVRDSIARILFADILSPIGDADPYYGPTTGESVRRFVRRVRAAVLALLPPVLLAASFYCVARYTSRLNQSVDLVVAMADSAARSDSAAAVGSRGKSPAASLRRDRNSAGIDSSQQARSATTTGRGPITQAEFRARALGQTTIGNIPLFAELTALYIGIFAGAMLALVLMALKEYAKEAIGLTEQDLVFSGWSSEAATDATHATREP